MKKHLLAFIFTGLAFVVATFFLPGLSYGGSSETLIRAAVVFGLLHTFIRPIIDLVLMPINFLTLGLLGGLTGLVPLWLVTVLVPNFVITDSKFPGYALAQINIPSYEINALLTAFLGAVLIGLISSVLYWLVG